MQNTEAEERKPPDGVKGIVSLQLVLLVFAGGLILMLLVTTVAIGFVGFRDHMVQELENHANDGAVAVGLSLSNAIDGNDRVAASSLIDATFDSSRYLKIRYENIAKGFVIEREAALIPPGIPEWFVQLIKLPSDDFRKTAQVVRGWQQLGTVTVSSHPAQGYVVLWLVMRQLVFVALIIGAAALLLLWLILRRTLRALTNLEVQAHAISKRNFRARAPAAGTRELAKVTLAMNQMANDLGQLFEGQAKLIQHLRKINNEDSATGLVSRRAFYQRVRTEVDSKDIYQRGVIALIQLGEFGQFNHEHGRKQGDLVLRQIAEPIRAFVGQYPGSFAGRLNGAEFGIFLPGVTAVDGHFWLEELIKTLDGVYSDSATGLEVAVYAGVAVVTEASDVDSLRAACDEALLVARAGAVTRCVLHEADGPVANGPADWQALLVDAIDNERIMMLFQPLVRASDGQVRLYQVQSRLEVDGEWVPASVFLPMTERFRLMARLDRLVLARVLKLLETHPDMNFGMTIGSSAVADAAFREHLQSELTSAGALARRLWFNVPEAAVYHHRSDVGALVGMLRRIGGRLIVDRFGVGGAPFSYLRNLSFQALRIDASFIRHVDSIPDNRFYVESIVPIAHSRGVEVFVAGVETAAEWHELVKLGIDGGTGYHLARPVEQL